MDLRPQIHSIAREATQLEGGMNGLAHQLLSCAHQAMRQAGPKAESLLGIGIAGSGLVNSQEGTMVMSSTIESIKHVPLRRIFEKEFAVPVQVTNFASAKAVAERTLGAGAMTEDMIYVEYGKTGIGAGIISGGKLLHGAGYAAGELGHTHMAEDVSIGCGNLGDEASVLGAGSIALEKHFEIPALKPPRFLIESLSGPPYRGPRPETPSAQVSDPLVTERTAPQS